MPCAQLAALPAELVQLILSLLPHSDLKNVAIVAKFLHEPATALLWRNVCLMDTSENPYEANPAEYHDEHNDFPIIRKLYVLADNPHIASKVHVLTHQCHLPTPTIFSELPYMHFDSPNLSQSQHMRDLIRLAVRNLTSVHTLRIVCGHRNITHSLLEGFLNPARPRRIPLRKLWLESCSLLGAKIDFGTWPSGLESIRIRRLRAERELEPADEESQLVFPEYRMARCGPSTSIIRLHDGQGGFYWTPVQFGLINAPEGSIEVAARQVEEARKIDDANWEKDALWHIAEDPEFHAQRSPSPSASSLLEVPAVAPALPLLFILKSAPTLTKLTLDWVVWRPVSRNDDEPARTVLSELSRLRFPNLRAFQVRNAVVDMTRLPDDIYLESTFLDFLEAHTKICCLAFPLDRFYSHNRPSLDVQARSRRLVANLGSALVDLRLDSSHSADNDCLSDSGFGGLHRAQERIRRRRFISEFAPYMTKLEHIKLEGGIPRDEKREIMRALHFCPLKRIIVIGVSFPLGNTWGPCGIDLKSVDDGVGNLPYSLEEEHEEATNAVFTVTPCVSLPFEFDPVYGWPASLPFLHTVAAHHADTVEELKVCGFNGCPVLSSPLPITKAFLYPLCYFHNLRQLIISFWLPTFFDGDHRDAQIIQSWRDTRSPASTALVVLTPPEAIPEEFNHWEIMLKMHYTPSALAERVAVDIGPFLSDVAKERKGGVNVRASFVLGAGTANDIFDLEVRVGKGNRVLDFVGPREEGEPVRWKEKVEGRRWF